MLDNIYLWWEKEGRQSTLNNMLP